MTVENAIDHSAKLLRHLAGAFAVADKTRSHKKLLELVYQMLCIRYGHDRVAQRFRAFGAKSYAKKERETDLIVAYVRSGKTQRGFARWAAEYNKDSPRPKRLGGGSVHAEAMEQYLKRALKRNPAFVIHLKRLAQMTGERGLD